MVEEVLAQRSDRRDCGTGLTVNRLVHSEHSSSGTGEDTPVSFMLGWMGTMLVWLQGCAAAAMIREHSWSVGCLNFEVLSGYAFVYLGRSASAVLDSMPDVMSRRVSRN